MRAAIRIGIPIRDYEEMTPRELNLHIQEYNLRTQRESEDGLALAYLTAYWHRVKRMPGLKEILNSIKPQKPLTDEELLAQIKALNAALGGNTKIRERTI